MRGEQKSEAHAKHLSPSIFGVFTDNDEIVSSLSHSLSPLVPA
jgi:hypothetical protein